MPDAFHVATKFYHFMMVPLISVETFLVFEGRERQLGREHTLVGWVFRSSFEGIPLPMSWKSVLVTCLRAASCLCGGIALYEGGMEFLTRLDLGIPLFSLTLVLSLISFIMGNIVFWLTYLFRLASPERARQLAALASSVVPGYETARQSVIRFSCPACGTKLLATRQRAKTRAICTKCSAPVDVPGS